MELATRRWVGRMIQVGLVLLMVIIVGTWFGRRAHRTMKSTHIQVRREAVPDEALAPGDLRIYNSDSTVDLILKGNQVLAGLSPKTIAKVRAEMQKESSQDTSGIGGLIASTVKQTVANAIGTHVVYPISEIREIRYQDGQLIIVRHSGDETHLFGNTKVDGNEEAKTFRREDAERFIAAVRARQAQVRRRPPQELRP